MKGQAAASAQRVLRDKAEKARKVFESTGRHAVLTPNSKVRAKELPAEVLEETLWLNKVGTFGVASAGYWWGRAGAAVMRLGHYFVGLP